MVKKFVVLAGIIFINTLFYSCKKSESSYEVNYLEDISPLSQTSIAYAQGFTITSYPNYKLLEISEAFPNSKQSYTYALVHNSNRDKISMPDLEKVDAIISVPLQSIVVTSTTHIPSLEMLGVENSLIGFPGLDYISSTLSRKRISNNQIKELGHNESLNTELTIELHPEVVVTFGVEGENKTLNTLERANIPIIYNGDWVEKHPLGKAEWIKFFGALYHKEKEADSIFNSIEANYIATKSIAAKAPKKPTVLSGAMYKDVWYVPKGDSWQAKIIEDAGGDYLWSNTKGGGSIALSVESVLEKAKEAAFWIAPAQYTSYSKLLSDNKVYGEFTAFKNRNAYTFAKKKGATGGVIYYELAPNRPDIVLKDLVSILHPDLMPTATEFFTQLDE